MDEVTKVLHGDPNKPGDVGYYGLKGIDAVNARQTTAKQLDDLITGARSKLGNSRQQIEFDSETRRMRNYWMGEIGRHYDQQLSVSAINSAKAGQDLAGQGMATAAANGDMAGFSLNVENMMKGAMREGAAKGWTQEEYDAKFGDIRSIATKQWVESRAVTDPAGAKEFLEHNKDALRGDEYAQLSRMVKTHADHAVANEFVNRIRRGGMVRGGAVQGRISQLNTDQTLDLIEQHESAGKNVPNYRFDNTHTAQGNFQITNSTWKQFAPEAGINLSQYPAAMTAPYDVQRQVAKTILTSPNGGGIQHWSNYNKTLARAVNTDTAQTPVNRTGLPPLADQFDAIDKSNMTPEQKEIAQTLASRRYTVLEADAARAERLKTEHDKAQVQQVADEVAQDVYSPNPKITPQAIANDPRLSSNFAMRDHLIRFVNDPPGSSVPTHQSNALAMSLIERMQPNYNKPDKIISLDQIMEQTKGLNRADWTFVNNQFKQQQQLGGETTRQQKAELMDAYKGQIVGIIQDKNLNAAGYARLYRYEHFVQSKLDEYQKAGKNPQELFDPNSPAFVAKPETLKGFEPSPQELLRDPQTGAAVDLTKYTEGDLIAAVKQGKVDRNLARVELARRIEAGQLAPPPTVPIR
jgi:hypothetical protein